MKPLFLSHTAQLGGAELELFDHAKFHASGGKVLFFAPGPLCDGLRAAGVETEVLATSFDVASVKRGSLTGLSPAVMVGLLRLAFQVARVARDYDVICANTQKAFLVGALAGKLAGRPVVWRLHDILSSEHFGYANRKLVTTFANLFAAKVIANSHATKEAFVRSGGRASLVQVVHNGIDPARFLGQAASDVRDVLGVGDAPLLGVFSRLSPWKGQDVLLEALAKVPETHALLVGGALFGEDAFETSLRAQVARLGLQERVHFLGFRSDIPALMLSCDAIVHTSVAPEPFGRVIVEGMLAGKPVVAARAGAVEEIIEDGFSGLLVQPGDADALARALLKLQDDPAGAATLALNAQQRANDGFSLQVILQRFAACLLEYEPAGLIVQPSVPSRSS